MVRHAVGAMLRGRVVRPERQGAGTSEAMRSPRR